MTAFLKMHGLGNDFAVFDTRGRRSVPGRRALARAIADRKTGIGCDQVIAIHRAPNTETMPMPRCASSTPMAARWKAAAMPRAAWRGCLMDEKDATSVRIATTGGMLDCREAADGRVSVDMGAPRFDWKAVPLAEPAETNHVPLTIEGRDYDASTLSVGNPHAVIFVDDAGAVPLAALGPQFEHHRMFPARVNTEFVEVLSRDKLRMRVWERGAGITRACGTGACAVAVAAHRRDLARPQGRGDPRWRIARNRMARRRRPHLDDGPDHPRLSRRDRSWRAGGVLMNAPLRHGENRIVTFGCRLNTYESEAMRARAAEAGLDNAIIFNTCAVTAEAVRQSRQAIRKARRENPNAKIIVTGCAAQTEPDTYAGMDEVDAVLGNAEKLQASSYADFGIGGGRARARQRHHVGRPKPRHNSWTVSKAAPAPSCRCRMAAIIAAPSALFPMAAGTRAACRWAR